jgi:ribose transport system substrate-binding protein
MKLFASASALVALTAIAACSDSKKATPSTTPTSAATSTASASNAALDAATAYVEKYSAPPTTVALTTPLKSKPAAGKTFVSLNCGIATCPYLNDQAKAATEALGWKFVSIPFDISNPANLVAAMKTALQSKPVAVYFAGLPQAVWGSVIPEYKKAGVAIIPNSAGDVTIDDTVIYSSNSVDTEQAVGKLVGSYYVSKTQAAGGEVMVVGFPDVPVLAKDTAAIKTAVTTGCPACKVVAVDVGIAAVSSGKASAEIVSALQRNPNVKYVLNTELNFTSDLPSRLKAAGLSGITIVGGHPDNLVMAGLVAGDYEAVVPTPLGPMAWWSVDAAARHAEGSTIPPEELPLRILTKDTVTTPLDKNSASLELPADYKQQLKKLWQVG